MKNIFKNFYIWQNIHIKNRYLIKKKSYSAYEEDLEIKKYFKKNYVGFYVDVGCYHPIKANNTLLLYQKNWSGINIDINKLSIDLFNFCRPKDTNLNFAVSKKKITKFYYQKELSLLNSIKKKQATQAFEGKFLSKKINSKSLNKILNSSKFKNQKIDFLDIDVEGADYDVLTSLDFKKYDPKLILIEIMPKNLDLDKLDWKNSNIYKFLKKKNTKRSGQINLVFYLKKLIFRR
ncbi:FkbM family methyltransferase [Candidatus Pelagibacter sp.]|nr:FkbM family methyltransferase [Candidatus Pelagibacter sp.]